MTEILDLPALKKLCEAATPGPWESFDGSILDAQGIVLMEVPRGDMPNGDAFDFVAAARTEMPKLIEKIEFLESHAKLGWDGGIKLAEENTALKAELSEWQQQAATTAEVIHRLSGRMENSKTEIENQALRLKVDNLEARDLHTCHAQCSRMGCVNYRLRELLGEAVKSAAWPQYTSELRKRIEAVLK